MTLSGWHRVSDDAVWCWLELRAGPAAADWSH